MSRRSDILESSPTAVDALRSWLLPLFTLALSKAPPSRSELESKCDWGKRPLLPLELVPAQHQCPGCAPGWLSVLVEDTTSRGKMEKEGDLVERTHT